MESANLDALKDRDFVLVVDKSGSMTASDTPTGQSRWDYAKESTFAIAQKIQQFDPDGIKLIPFAGSFKTYDGVTAEKVDNVWREHEPMGGTILAPVLKSVFQDYLSRKKAGNVKTNGEMLVVMTDGEPQDKDAVAKEIVNFTKSLDNGDGEYGIAFIQVGKDVQASRFLKKLDDDLTSQGAKFDIVDTKTMEELETVGLTDALIAALND